MNEPEECSNSSDEEHSSTSNQPVQDVLAEFREKWQKELRISPKHTVTPTKANKEIQDEIISTSSDIEEQARKLFLKGVEMERSGKLYEAIQFYRRAVQIVPDIEFRLEPPKITPKEQPPSVEESPSVTIESDEPSDIDSDEEEIEEGKLLPRIQKKLAKSPTICYPHFEHVGTHISQLPIEIIFLILRWLVSNDLDLKSLESFSGVCRGFYLCARDSEIWRLACLRVWGLNCGCSPGSYGTWRNMFIERGRVQFNGCYISKTTYIRHGENSFQDQFYRPWYIVAYFRYLRFFPDGKVLFLTTAEEPAQSVGHLKYKNAKNPVLTGYYRIKDDKVTLIVQKMNDKTGQTFKRNKRKDKDNMYETAEQTFHMELQIKNHRQKRHMQLIWTHYSIYTRNVLGHESTCNFDIVPSTFPPLWFSRVKSYTTESESPLQ